MAHDPFAPFPPELSDEDARFGVIDDSLSELEYDNTAPSLAIILISAACGVGFGVIGLYFAYQLLGWTVQLSAAAAVLAASVGLGISGALLSAITGSRAAVANIFFSCGLVIATVIFFGLCTLVGAIAATFVLSIR